jgi:hypothetical protein
MLTKKLALVAALVLGAGLVTPAASAADSTTYPRGTDYRGVFDRTVEFTGFPAQGGDCLDVNDHPVVPATQDLSGTWRANVGTTVVSARFVMYVNGEPHVVYTAPMYREETTAVFQAGMWTGAGQLTISLVGDEFTYTIAPYDTRGFFSDGVSCASATFHGTLS